jgi:hypothetical protein
MQLVKEIKTRQLQNEIHLYKYEIYSSVLVENLPRRVISREIITESEDYILGEEEDTVSWRLVRILIDGHNISRGQAEDIIHENKDEIVSGSEVVEIDDEDNSITVRIKRQNIGIIEPETVLEYGVKICQSVNRIQRPRKPKSRKPSVKKQRKPRRK